MQKEKFDVNCTEKEKAFGGQLNLADKPPHKEKNPLVCGMTYNSNVKNAGVKLIFGVTANKDILLLYNPEIVINATGGNAVFPSAFKEKMLLR